MVRHPRSSCFQAKLFFPLPILVAALTLSVGGSRVWAGSSASVEAAPIPPLVASVEIAATVPIVIARTGDSAVATFTRTGGDPKKMFVYYTLKGTAKNGIDYRFVNGRLKIKPNKTSARLNLTPLISQAGGGVKTIRVKVRPDAAYSVGANKEARLYINFGG